MLHFLSTFIDFSRAALYTFRMNKTLKNLRIQNNYSQAAVASFLGISRQMYIKYESGAALPSAKTVVDLANFYRVPYDVILDDKLSSFGQEQVQNGRAEVSYEIKEKKDAPLKVHDSGAFGEASFSAAAAPSYYLTAILQMLPKLVYREQLKVLEKISGIVQAATEERLKPDKRMQAYQKLEELVKKYHPNSHGQKWTREELYER